MERNRIPYFYKNCSIHCTTCTISLQPTDKEEIVVSSLNSNKASGPNRIPVSVLKTAKLVPVLKKDSKLDYMNYRPISLLLNIEKILEKLMYTHR